MEPLVLTHSDLKSFLGCRRRWLWSYLQDYTRPEKLTGALALGSRVHNALELYYRDGLDPIVEHQRLASEDLAKLSDSDAPPWEMDQMYEDIVIGRNCVTAHQEWLAETGADDPYEIAAVEQMVEAPILGGRVILRGKVDVLFREKETGFLIVNDLKTMAAQGIGLDTREALEKSWQHHLYMAVLRISRPEDHVAGAYYTAMRKVKRPERTTVPMVERWRAPGTTRMADAKLRQVEALCEDVLRVVQSIEDGTTALDACYPNPSNDCRWCPFRQPCEVADESPLAVEDFLSKEYLRGRRHARYGVV